MISFNSTKQIYFQVMNRLTLFKILKRLIKTFHQKEIYKILNNFIWKEASFV